MEIITIPYNIIQNLSTDKNYRLSNRENTRYFAAVENRTTVGLAETITFYSEKTIMLRHLRIITPYIRKGIGSTMLSEIISCPDFKDFKMYAYFNSEKYNVAVADAFFTHNGYCKVLQSYEYRIKSDAWLKFISTRAPGKTEPLSHTKSYSQLSSKEKTRIEKICKQDIPEDNLSIYAFKDGEIIGWCIAGIYNRYDLYLYSSYVFPEYRNNMEGFTLWKAVFDEDRLKSIGTVRNIVFCVDPANHKVNRLLNLFMEKGAPIEKYENYTVDLK